MFNIMNGKKRILSILLCLLTLALIIIAPASTVYAAERPSVDAVTTAGEMAEEILGILAAHSPSSMRILESEFMRREGTTISTVVSIANGSISAWVTDWEDEATHTRRIDAVEDLIYIWCTDGMELITALSFAVHENYHGYQDADVMLFAETIKRNHIVDDGGVIISFQREGLEWTEQAAAGIPNNLRTGRWETYVSEGAATVANRWGAYGLLEEFSAYYYDAMSTIDATAYVFDFIDKHGITVTRNNYSFEMICSYLHNLQENKLAFYEFSLWMLEYMLYVQENRPDLFQAIMGNDEFVMTFAYFHAIFDELLHEQYPNAIADLRSKLSSLGVNLRETNERFWFRQSGRRELGLGKLNKEIDGLRKRLETGRYSDMLKSIYELAEEVRANMPDLTILLSVGLPEITINGISRPLDEQGTVPVIVNNSTLVPLRAIFEAFGLEVTWDNGEIIGVMEDVEIRLSIGEMTAYINGEEIELNTPPQLMNNRTMVPLRFIAESLGANVEWVPQTRSVVITVRG